MITDALLLIRTNEFQTPLTEDLLNSYPEEILEWLFEAISDIEFIKWLISPDRPRAKDLQRDDKGRIIVDVTHPHILEDTDYFRPAVLHFKEYGCYTFLKPNPSPQSEFQKFWREEIRRCREGYVRESDGEWITGYCYWFLNYNPMMINILREGSSVPDRIEDFPLFFEGIYWRFHYLYLARKNGKHAIELSKRGSAKSYTLSSIMTHNLILGENEIVNKRVTTILTAYQKEYLTSGKDGTFEKFIPSLEFIRANTLFPKLLLKNTSNDMSWQMGYIDKKTGITKGSFNKVIGVSAKDDPDKLRGKRGNFLIEEMGTFHGLLTLYDTIRRGVEDGKYAFGLIYLVGTANESESDFSSAKTLLYKTLGYNIFTLKNVWDKTKQGKDTFGFFFPAYINRLGCYNKDGVSDVIKALLEIFEARYLAKYSADPKSVLKVICEDPITPAEAIIKVKQAYFPVAQLNERLMLIDSLPNIFNDVYVGNLVWRNDHVEFVNTNDIPIRKYKVENTTQGALEIYEMPLKDSSGRVFNNRYIIGHDPVDNDLADSSSLSSTFVLDLFTDRIVAEYTGRKPFADDNFEITRLLCLFYNAKCLYEAHPYSQKVYTPEGIKLWKDIKIGDKLFSPTKGIVTVIDIPIDEEMPIYKITLEDGRVIEASDNHIWLVYKGSSKIPTELTTKQMLKNGVKTKWNQSKFFLPEHNGVEYNYKKLPIDPYTMGLILSEGSIRRVHCFKNGIQISSADEDMKFYSNNIPYNVKHIGNRGVSWHVYIPNCKDIMINYNLYGTDSYTKFIPDDYLYSNRVQRMELLKGLMDGDGCAKTGGASIFITCSEKLANNVLSLSRSLGIKSWLQPSREGVYRVAIASIHKIFKLPRKVVEQHVYSPYSKGSKAYAILDKTAIKSIEYSHTEMGKCVTVNSDDGLYLIGDYVVTHNCNKKGIFAYFQKMQCTHLLADTPLYLRDKLLVKYSAFGSNQKGVNANSAINNYANNLIRDWLLTPIKQIIKQDGSLIEVVQPRLYELRNRALIEELIEFTPEINVDRIRSLGMLMLYREEFSILYQGNVAKIAQKNQKPLFASDDFFARNYKTTNRNERNQ